MSCQRTIEMYSDYCNRKRDPNKASHGIKTLQLTTQRSSVYTQNQSCFYVRSLKNKKTLTPWNLTCELGQPRVPTGRPGLLQPLPARCSTHGPSTNPKSGVDVPPSPFSPHWFLHWGRWEGCGNRKRPRMRGLSAAQE